MSEVRTRRRRSSREYLHAVMSPRKECPSREALSPASRIRIAADVHRHSTSDDDSGCVLEEYAWVPSGLKPDLVHLYFSALPEDRVPYVNSVGERWRQRQLRHQLPPQDSDASYCTALSREEADELRAFERGRKDACLGRGIVQRAPYDGRRRACPGCPTPIEEGDLCVYAMRSDRWFHPACFRCTSCRELLVDLVFFNHQGQVYCGRHHAEQIKPRCGKCDELIFGEECTEAEGRTWHLEHFQCEDCDRILGGQKYMQRAGKPRCLSCFHSTGGVDAIVCAACRMIIPGEQPHITQGDTHWHASSSCFSCCVCAKNLLGERYSLLHGALYCGYKSCGERETRAGPSAPRTRPPRPPQRAPPPPPPPAENIYETVLPCGSASPEIEKRAVEGGRRSGNYYSTTPNRLARDEVLVGYSTSSSDSEDDDFYVNSMMAAASLNKVHHGTAQPSIRTAKKTKQNTRCIVS